MKNNVELEKKRRFSIPCVRNNGASTNGKSGDFGSPMWRFESSRPSQFVMVNQVLTGRTKE